MKMRKVLAIITAAALTMAMLTACGGSSEEPKADDSATEETTEEEGTDDAAASDVKIGLLLSGSANDGGWSQLAADAVTAAAEAYGVETNFSESLASTDFESTMRGYADNGYTIIVSHGAEFLDTSKLVSADYPDVQFVNTSAMAGQAPNLAALDFGSYQLGYLTGYLAGITSENGKIGVVCALEGDTTVLCNSALEEAAKLANPNAEVTVVYTGSYDDQLKAKQAAQELIGSGCDVIVENADAAGIGAIQQCQEDGVPNISCANDYSDQASCMVSSVYQNVFLGIQAAIEKAIDGTLESSDGATMMAAAEGVVGYTPIGGDFADRITDEEAAAMEALYQEALAGGHLAAE